jgi:hypothetical protein
MFEALVLIIFLVIAIPATWYTVKICYLLLYAAFTLNSDDGVSDEVDGMYVQVNGKVRVDGDEHE